MIRRPLVPTRRTVLAGLALAPLAACASTEAPLPANLRIRSVRIDTAPLAARGLPTWAERIRTIAEASARTVFADRAPAGVDITLVADQAWLASYNGGGALPFDDDPPTDWIEGWIVLSATQGAAPRRLRLYSSTFAADSGPWYAPDIDRLRLERLTRAWVADARRRLAA